MSKELSIIAKTDAFVPTKHEEQVPYNLEAEQSLLGILLLDNSRMEAVSEFLRAFHFADGIHAKIFEGITRLVERGQIADPITLKDYFDREKALEPVGGAKYLVDLASNVLSFGSATDYGKLIHDLYLRRELLKISQDISVNARVYDFDESALNQIESAEKQLFDLATKGQNSGGFINFGTAVSHALHTAELAFKRDGNIVGVTSGLLDLDKYLGGLHPSDLLILAGRPAMGKTSLATNIAFNAASAFLNNNSNGAPVAFFSLEMSAEQLATRIMAAESGVSSDKMRRGDIKTEDFPKFVEVTRRLNQLPLFIDDTPAISINAVRNRSRRLQRQHGLGLIVIDYLQLLEAGGSKKGSDNRVQEISEISRGLKAIAKELNVPVIALSQLSRAVEQRDDKRPQLSDLRESGSIEQDADVVMFVFREEYYLQRKQPPEGTEKYREWQEQMAQVYQKAEIIIAKQRHGPVGTIRLFFDGNLTRFGNLTENYLPEY
ncbi:replicative DNA helicase [Candidatus Paracaedibacter symbiosus]|uniref:replicative DNA helicase n=1 Tax=Candidatus Paracaedibacter symbiosus TaxID=244582 RepID=UPI000509EB48|nr:replicative DNA helicase [Candidatus Paracaedibacter symbiosus]